MIDEQQTSELYGYTSDMLSPGSRESIIIVCDNCGKEQISSKGGYHKLCESCEYERNWITETLKV